MKKAFEEYNYMSSEDLEWSQELAVNPFVIAEEKWKHENYHSKILAGLLRSKIGDHALLKSFLEYLSKIANPTLGAAIKKLRVTDGVLVETEATTDNNRRIDILIKDKKWAIIVENKIDGAPDENRQIPDYLNFVQKGNDGVPVVAIVYLKAYLDNAGPTDRAGWTVKESKEIDAKLIPVAGVKTREDGWMRSLDGGWLHGTSDFQSALQLGCIDQTLSAYSQLLWAQAAEIWQDDQIAREYEQAMEGGKMKFSEAELAGWLVRKVERECSTGLFRQKLLWRDRDRPECCVFQGLDFEGGKIFALDVNCKRPGLTRIKLEVRYGGGVDTEKLFKTLEPVFSKCGLSCCKPPRGRNFVLQTPEMKLTPAQLVVKTNDIIAQVSAKVRKIQDAYDQVKGVR